MRVQGGALRKGVRKGARIRLTAQRDCTPEWYVEITNLMAGMQ
jgi:hypothetical protein